ncbi:MAG TPA: sugar transferase, partial [Planctomycetota bacterium]|nr:sugar transferase [Planctomycetota bacterium]
LALLPVHWLAPWEFYLPPLTFLFALLGGHLLSLVVGFSLPRTPLSLAASRRMTFRVGRALARTPWAAFRVAEETNLDPWPIPEGVLHDYRALVTLPDGPLQLHGEGLHSGMGRLSKRALDLLLATVLLPILLPLVLGIALLIRIQGPGRAFYTQIRVTRDGRSFPIVKLRSMIPDAEPSGQAVWPVDHDPRITPLGHILRKYWLDELPQLINVLLGHLSWVGPRPERPSFIEEFRLRWPNYDLRHQAKAGMTGLAQVLGFTGNTSIQRRLVSDLHYIRRWSLGLDLWLILSTAFRMTRRPDTSGSGRCSSYKEKSHFRGNAEPVSEGDQRGGPPLCP